MKYKVGDVVKLKSAEELMKLGNWLKESAEVCGGKIYEIKDISGFGTLISDDLYFDEESVDCLVSKGNFSEQGCIYTFDELKKRVDSIKDYATKLSSELNVGLSIEVETDIDDYRIRRVKGSSRINIID